MSHYRDKPIKLKTNEQWQSLSSKMIRIVNINCYKKIVSVINETIEVKGF